MRGYPFNLPLEKHSITLPIDTDTATPRFPIPIYFIHSFEQPFCTDETCTCQRQPQAVRQLFIHIVEGKLTLEQASALLEGGQADGAS
jgi:hypothetical protein